MIRNDYRRALILLRSAVKGMSGHVRLEKRTLTGSMRFSVSGAGSSDNLRALLLRKGKAGWAAVPMGALHVDNRGQAGMTWTFDPRNIDGYALEDYPVVAVVQMSKGGTAEPALSGFLNGSAEVDWAQAMSAARMAYRHPDAARKGTQQAVPAMEIPPQAPTQAEVQPEIQMEAQPEIQMEAQPEIQMEAQPETQMEAQPEIQMEAQPETQMEEPEPVGGLPEAETPPEAEETQEQPTEIQEKPIETQEQQTEVQEEQTEVQEMPEEQPPAQQPAGFSLALDISIPWPDAVEPLRALFLQLPACMPFPADGYTFVCAPLPGNGQAYSLVGVRVEDEQPTSVCYGIPGIFAPEPPVGLDGYMWRGSGVSGWWVTFVDALTGEEVPAE